MVWRATQAGASPLQRILPRVKGRFDIACGLILAVLVVLYIEAVNSILHINLDFDNVIFYGFFKLIALLLEMYTLFMFVQAILSWVGPG
ncbi:hypothetical protein ACP3WZ_24855, partial [Salmonella enterica]|uniref:hypothetical protein n=1 Tax=Salmonella enterica TaxID=28901 RepID=UPI003CF0A5B4